VQGVFSAEPAIFIQFQPVRCVFLVFHGVVIALLAFRAGKGYFNSHIGASVNIILISLGKEPASEERIVQSSLYKRKPAYKKRTLQEVTAVYHNLRGVSRLFFKNPGFFEKTPGFLKNYPLFCKSD